MAEIIHIILIFFGIGLIYEDDNIYFTILFTLFVGISMNWSANTVGHIHLHNPIFRANFINVSFDKIISISNSYPQSIWKFRHLQHHAGSKHKIPFLTASALYLELALILFSWTTIALLSTRVLLAFVAGSALGLFICWVQGKYEHYSDGRVVQEGISHYGRVYNTIFFNDGFHIEHHRYATRHWTELPSVRVQARRESSLPPQLRWAERGQKWRVA